MKKITVLVVCCFTLLLAYDYFPSFSQMVEVPKSVIIFLLLGLVVASIFFPRRRSVDNKDTLKWQVFITSYIVFIIGLFTILGGESATGISFNNGFFWLVLLLSLVDMFTQWKKGKRAQQSSS